MTSFNSTLNKGIKILCIILLGISCLLGLGLLVQIWQETILGFGGVETLF